MGGMKIYAQSLNDSCIYSTFLCANNITFASSFSATASADDPILDCGDGIVNNSVWFSFTAVNNGSVTIQLSGITGTGFAMEAYTGGCGSMVAVPGACIAGATPSLNLTFAITAGTTYYIMVDGEGGNQQDFFIDALSSDIIASPDANFTANPSIGCAPLVVNLHNTTVIHGGTNITYAWSFDGGPSTPWSGADTSTSFAVVGAHTIALTVCNDECGCKILTQNIAAQKLVDSITFNPFPSCMGEPIFLKGGAKVTPAPGSPNISSWHWDFGDPASGTNDSSALKNPTHIFVGTGPNDTCFRVTLTVHGYCGVATIDSTICFKPTPHVFAGNDTLVCNDSTAFLHSTPSQVTNPVTYLWTGSGGTITSPNSQNTTVSGLTNAGSPYTFIVHITTAIGCHATDTVVVRVNPRPKVHAIPDTTVCPYSPVNLHAVVDTSVGIPHYTWVPSAGLSSSTIANPIAIVSATTTYCVRINDTIGCPSHDSCATITIFPKPTISAVPPTLCASDTNMTAVITVNGAGTPATFSWMLTIPTNYALIIGANSDSSSITVRFPQNIVASYIFKAVVHDANGCTDTISFTYNVTSGLPMTHNGPFTICIGQSVSLSATGASTYSWYSVPVDPTLVGQTTLSNPTVIPTVTTTYYVVGTGAGGFCTKLDSIHVTVNPLPIVVANISADSVCGCTPVTLDGTGSTPGLSYHWRSSNGNSITSANSLSTIAIACVTDTFTLVVTNQATGCKDSAKVFVKVNPRPIAVAAAISPVCGCSTVNLNGTGSTVGMSYLWISLHGSTIANANAITTTANVCSNDTFLLIVTAPVTLCKDTARTSVVVNTIPTAVAAPIPDVCGCTTVNLTGTGSTVGLSYHWTSLNGNVITNPNILNTTAVVCTSDVFKLVVTNGTTGCKDSITTSVTYHPKPEAVFNFVPDTICHSTVGTINLNGIGSNTNVGTIYNWSANPPAVIFDTTALVTTAIINGTTVFTLKVTSIFGCDSIITKTVHVYPSPTITNSHNSFCTSDTHPWNTTIAVNGAGAGTTYNWFIVGCSSPSTTSGQSQTFDMSACPIGTTSFTVITIDGLTGCYDTLRTSVIIDSSVVLTTSHDTAICFGDSLRLTASGSPNYAWAPGGATTSSILASPPLSVGVHPFTVTGTLGGCHSTATITVTVNTTPNTPNITGPTSLCVGSNGSVYAVSPADVGANYVWSVPSNGTIVSGQGTNSITVNWGAGGSGNVSVTETIGSCTGATRTISVAVHPNPTTSTIFGNITNCIGATSIDSVNRTTGSTYLWTVSSGGTIVAGQGTSIINISWNTIGQDTITVIETNSFGCIGIKKQLIVTVYPLPVTSSINGSPIVCANSTGEIYSVVNTTGSLYHWTINGGIITNADSTTNNITVTWGAAGTGTITVTEVSAYGCVGAVRTLVITIRPKPTAAFTIANNDSVCVYGTIQLTGTATNGTIFWTTSGNGTFSNPTISNPIYTAGSADVGLVTITMTVSNSPCPDAVTSHTIHVLPAPNTSVIAGNDSLCAGTNGVTYAVGLHAGDTYVWSISPPVNISTGQGTNLITINWPNAGTYTVTVIESNAIGSFHCPGSEVSLVVVVNPLPVTTNIVGSDTVCENSTGSIYFVGNTTGSTYTWTVPAGAAITAGQGTNSITVTWGTTSGAVTVTEVNHFGCSGVAQTFNVVVNHTPTATATGPGDLCQGGTIQLTGSSTNGKVHWSTNGTGFFNNDTLTNPTYTAGANDVGNFALTMTVSNPPCGNALAVVNIVIHPTPVVVLTANPDTICYNSSTTINATGGGSYVWSTGSNAASITVSPTTNTTYNVTVTSAFSCTATKNIDVVVLPPGYGAAGKDQTICADDSAILSGTYSANANGGIWTTTGDGRFTPSATDPNASYHPGTADTTAGTVNLIFTSSGACINFGDTMVLTVEPVPVVNAGTDQTIVVGQSAQLAGYGMNALNYYWSTTGTGAFSPSDSVMNATYTPSAQDILDRKVTIILTSRGGCRDVSDTMIISIIPNLIPNIITPYPASPGVNDRFEILGLPPGSSLTIFNRWGLKIYESSDYPNNWDAEGVSDGTYFYVLKMDGKETKGSLIILREE